MAYEITAAHNGRMEQATLDIGETSQRDMGVEVTWEVTLDDGTVVMTISEYPAGGFTEVEKHADLETTMDDIVDVIRRDREAKEPPSA
jgi:hypothetical protein